jgi:phosphate transport system substrate-binding protein
MVLVVVPLVLVAAACGPKKAASVGPPTPTVATTPAASSVTLWETGSKDLYPLVDAWAAAYHLKYPKATVTTEGTVSEVGISQVASGAVTIGASGASLSDAEITSHPGLMNIAVALTALYVDYNLPGITEHLKLDGKVLAAMYNGTIKTWNDPQVAALNPGVNLPATAVVPLHRSDGSGDTFLFTQYLAKQDPDGWGKSPGAGTMIEFPAVPGGKAEDDATGTAGMVSDCAATPGCVTYHGTGYLDVAHQKGLGEAQLGNASGNFVLADAKSIQAEAASFASQTPPNQSISLINGPAADGYPLVNFQYAVVYGKQRDAATAQTLQAFLHWAVTDGSNPSFWDGVHTYLQPLPEGIVKLSDAQIVKINS